MRNDECRMTNARMPRFCIQHSTFCILPSAFASRLPYFAQAVVEQFPLVGVGDVLPQEGFRVGGVAADHRETPKVRDEELRMQNDECACAALLHSTFNILHSAFCIC